MILAPNEADERSQHPTGLDAQIADKAQTSHELCAAASDAEAAADEVADHWIRAANFLILGCKKLVAALQDFENQPEKIQAFLRRLVARGILSENDVLARLKANGKLAMLSKIGKHADVLLQQSFLRVLALRGYSVAYQVCLLIEEAGVVRALAELSNHPEVTRDDVVRIRATLRSPKGVSHEKKQDSLDGAAQLFAMRLTGRDARLFVTEYAQSDTLANCLRCPLPADDAGLVAVVPIATLGAFERNLMPVLGFGSIDGLFLESDPHHPEITDFDVIVVAGRGSFRAQALTEFRDAENVLDLAEFFFPGCAAKHQLFADCGFRRSRPGVPI
ncbi:hypothetical protein [Bradyrhizobium sp. 195]|uniref:hypothetical protein n=1 Tax=Bradyrhizobium sp. 195 TaxID=2782662 RepID=UPI0020013D08|nr:hypothetical protein [Bradyrhizobium sp. 195]UPK26738.1 hypothetical protein IVB26_36835 [Bradyrhizobium sp. 195]